MNHAFLQSKLGEDYHTFVYKILFYILCAQTLQLLLLFKTPAFYKRWLDKFFNYKFSLFKHNITFYFVIILWIMLLILCAIILRLQLFDYQNTKWNEINDMSSNLNTFYKNKWILEAELWMTMINLVEAV